MPTADAVAQSTQLAEASVPDKSRATDKPEFEPLVKPSVALYPAAGEIRIDGELDDPGWLNAVRISGFTEVQPGDQLEPQVDTEAFITYDEGNLYVAFRAFDDPKSIRANLRNRDEMFSDDWVGFLIDTYGDATQAYEIFVNPLGVQGDLLMSPNGSEDVDFDMIYYSEGKITPTGYQVEIKVPMSSLRFPNRPVQEWKATFIRNHPRDVRRIYSWATVNGNDPCLMCQFGSITGIQGVKPGTSLQIMPSVVGYQAGALIDSDNPGEGYKNDKVNGELSLNMRYDFTSSLAAEATINPDFSQIESDAAQIDVNSTVALFYPERRPFFQEGADMFNSWLNVVYTRSINSPIAAAKMTGRMGQTRIGFLSAVDDATPMLMPFQDRSELVTAGRSVSNILRVRHSLGNNSFVGGIVTDRRLFDGGSGTVISSDLRLQFFKNYTLETQVALSSTVEPDDPSLTEDLDEGTFANGRHTIGFDGESFQGFAFYTTLDRGTRHWNFGADYSAYSPTFRTDNGFVTLNDRHQLRTYQRIHVYPKNSFFVRLSPGVFFVKTMDYGWGKKGEAIVPSLSAELKGQTYLYTEVVAKRERYKDVDFSGLVTGLVNVNTNFSDKINGGGYVSFGRDIARNEDVPVAGRRLSAGSNLTIRPLPRLTFSSSLNYSRLKKLDSDEKFYEGFILRTGMGYQFSRELSVRLITQYNEFDEVLSLEPLLSYKINPFTVFYVGSTHGYGEYDEPYGFIRTSRQVFFKFQYLFQR